MGGVTEQEWLSGKKPRKAKKKNLKRKADGAFSRYIRVKYADINGMVRCCSCGSEHHMKDVDAGHFVPRQFLSLRFSELNVHPQCTRCNTFSGGNPLGYAQFLLKTYGKGILDKLDEKKKEVVQYKEADYREIADMYSKKAQHILENEGLEW